MKYLQSYNNYITELKRFINKSNSGSTRWIDSIYDDENPDPRSAASSILLKNKLKQEEFEDLMRLASDHLPEYVIKHFQDNPEKKNKIEKFLITMNNLKYLKDMLKERGELRCEYCNKGPLVIYDINTTDITPEHITNPNIKMNDKFNPKDGATCDHKQPQSKGGDKFDYNNLAVACNQCNKRKGNKTWEEWVKIMNLKESVDFSSEKQIIDDILLELKDSNFYIEISEEETDNPNKTFLLLRIQYDLNPEDEMWNLPRAYRVPLLSLHTFKWDSVRDTILRLVEVIDEVPNIDLYFMKYAKVQNDSLSGHKVEFIHSRADGDDFSMIENADINDEIQFVDIVFIKEVK